MVLGASFYQILKSQMLLILPAFVYSPGRFGSRLFGIGVPVVVEAAAGFEVVVDGVVATGDIAVVLGEDGGVATFPVWVPLVELVPPGATAIVSVVIAGAAPPPGRRYQLATGSCRHSPAVTPLHPFCLMRLK